MKRFPRYFHVRKTFEAYQHCHRVDDDKTAVIFNPLQAECTRESGCSLKYFLDEVENGRMFELKQEDIDDAVEKWNRVNRHFTAQQS